MSRAALVAAPLALGLASACERDPTLNGYWEIVELSVGATAEDAANESLAGSLEFTSDGKAYAVYAYTWDGSLQPDPTPDLVSYTWTMLSTAEEDDLGYRSEDETYTLELGHPGPAPDVFAILDWQGSSVTLRSEQAAPPPAAADTPLRFVRMKLER